MCGGGGGGGKGGMESVPWSAAPPRLKVCLRLFKEAFYIKTRYSKKLQCNTGL